MSKITVYADYVCPFCLLAKHMVADVIRERNIHIASRPSYRWRKDQP